MTTTDLVDGRITSFKKEQAFGVITLDDGTAVKFDAGICTMVPEEGASVRLRVGPAKWGGGLKALYVEPAAAPAFIAAPRPPSLEDQLAAVQREHLVSGLSEQILGELIADAFAGEPERATLLDLLDAYYAADPVRARSDGYLRRSTRPAPGAPDIGDALGALTALLPDAKLPVQVRWTTVAEIVEKSAAEAETVPYEKAEELADPAGGERGAGAGAGAVPLMTPKGEPALGTLVVRDPDGREREIAIATLDDVVELVNAALRRIGDGRRVYRLRTGDAWRAYFALASDRALRLAAALPFEPPPDEIA
jgi:hypothetical protein